jgi:SAM-dependent methyltransferase
VREIVPFGRAGDDGSLSHYQRPAHYWRSYARRKRDVDYYVALARQHGCVLEYGIGNGRIALPMARAGVEVHGVDLSRPMLADLAARLQREPKSVQKRVVAQFGDMRRMRLGARFPLVFAPFNVLLHLYSERELTPFFSRVHEHLEPKGQFVLDVSVPDPADLSRDPQRSTQRSTLRDPDTGDKVSYRERFEYDPTRQLLVTWSEFTDKQYGYELRVPLTQRQFFPAELEALLAYAGFKDIRMLPDFGMGEAGGRVDSLVFCCRSGRTP